MFCPLPKCFHVLWHDGCQAVGSRVHFEIPRSIMIYFYWDFGASQDITPAPLIANEYRGLMRVRTAAVGKYVSGSKFHILNVYMYLFY